MSNEVLPELVDVEEDLELVDEDDVAGGSGTYWENQDSVIIEDSFDVSDEIPSTTSTPNNYNVASFQSSNDVIGNMDSVTSSFQSIIEDINNINSLTSSNDDLIFTSLANETATAIQKKLIGFVRKKKTDQSSSSAFSGFAASQNNNIPKISSSFQLTDNDLEMLEVAPSIATSGSKSPVKNVVKPQKSKETKKSTKSSVKQAQALKSSKQLKKSKPKKQAANKSDNLEALPAQMSFYDAPTMQGSALEVDSHCLISNKKSKQVKTSKSSNKQLDKSKVKKQAANNPDNLHNHPQLSFFNETVMDGSDLEKKSHCSTLNQNSKKIVKNSPTSLNYKDMVFAAIKALDEEAGSNRVSISNYILENFLVASEVNRVKQRMRQTLRVYVKKGQIIQLHSNEDLRNPTFKIKT